MKRLYSITIEPKGESILQAQRLIWSLRALAKVSQEQIVLHIAGILDKSVRKSLEKYGVLLIEVDPFQNHPRCNKLQQLNFISQRSFSEVVLLDCDTIILREPKSTERSILATPEETVYPPMNFFQALFREAGIMLQQTYSTLRGDEIVKGYANRSVYIIPGLFFNTLSRAWQYWANWCLDRKGVLGDYWIYLDQLSFAMAINSELLEFEALNVEFNFPTHIKLPSSFDCNPAIIHYHKSVDVNQNLLTVTEFPKVNAAITQVNFLWSHHFRQNFDNISFWNSRYALHPEFGAGKTSIGEWLELKQDLLKRVVELISAKTVIDIGGGDGKTMSDLQNRITITALDASIMSKALYLKRIPNAAWYLHDICIAPFHHNCDLTICLELLSHCSTNDDYQRALDNICLSSQDLLISGFDAQPNFCGQTQYFHEPLSESLRKRGRIPIPIFFYSGFTLFFSPRNNFDQHPRDIQIRTLDAAIPLVYNPILLMEAIYVSRQNFGFFPDHLPRCIEYPWIIDSLSGQKGLRIIDAGAGISSLPLMIAKRGHKVFTVDPHSKNTIHTPKNTWTEWGFFDYNTLNNQIISYNIPYEDTDDDLNLDVVISVSVIEHLTRQTRLKWLKKARTQLREGGSLLLTVDTVPFSIKLYNFNEGNLVEDETIHGNLQGLIKEIEENGFAIKMMHHSNWLPRSRVAIARIHAIRKN